MWSRGAGTPSAHEVSVPGLTAGRAGRDSPFQRRLPVSVVSRFRGAHSDGLLRRGEATLAGVRRIQDVASAPALRVRLARLDWKAIDADLWQYGHAATAPVLTRAECDGLVGLYPKDEHFRKTIHMGPRRFGEGDYKYFHYPLPRAVQELRVHLYRRLALVANAWMESLGAPDRYPTTLRQFLARCHRNGQKRPTPLLLHYEAGGYNCLHQDLYGPLAFPLQATVFLSRPSQDYGSGAFLLYELRPRAQSMCDALVPEQGALVIFATRMRPERGARGFRRVQLKHGVARVRFGSRYTLGIIFHDAK